MANYRIIKENGRIKYAGTDEPSWLTLEMAREKIDYTKNEMIYEYNKNSQKLWQIF